MPYCSNCGKAVAQGVKFCPECGTAMPGLQQTLSPRPKETGGLPEGRRPLSILLLIVLDGIGGVYMLFVGFAWISLWFGGIAGSAALAGLGGIVLLDGFLSVAIAWGVLKEMSWSKRFGMIQGFLTLGLGLVFSLLGTVQGVLALLLGGWTLFMFTRPYVLSYLHLR